ncbi:MAG: glycoside hydrolase domain-containing protein, partial [Planctomycetota bacterium]
MSGRYLRAIALLAAPALLFCRPSGAAEGRAQGGFRVWSLSPMQVPGAGALAPDAPSARLTLVGVRNGSFSAQLVVGDGKPIRGLKVEVSDLRGPGTIPASAARVRYALYDGVLAGYGARPSFFDSLEGFPPVEVPLVKGRAVQPVWIAVSVPADARPGEYAGRVTVGAAGQAPVSVPLSIKVLDWKLPEPRDFGARMDIVQSPESVALAYDVPLWSDAHLKLLDKSFALIAPLAGKSLYVSCIRRTHFGNEHAMVRWVMNDDGDLKPDFSVVEKYVDVAVRRLGKPSAIIFYCWEPPESGGHAGGTNFAVRIADRQILITVVDPETGELSPQAGPAWGTPEAGEFWKKMTDGLRP